jgi:hypothetical protein
MGIKFMLHIVPTVPASPERERLAAIAHRTG